MFRRIGAACGRARAPALTLGARSGGTFGTYFLRPFFQPFICSILCSIVEHSEQRLLPLALMLPLRLRLAAMSSPCPTCSNKLPGGNARQWVFCAGGGAGLAEIAGRAVRPGAGLVFPARKPASRAAGIACASLAASILRIQALSSLDCCPVAWFPSHGIAGSAEICHFSGHGRLIVSYRTCGRSIIAALAGRATGRARAGGAAPLAFRAPLPICVAQPGSEIWQFRAEHPRQTARTACLNKNRLRRGVAKFSRVAGVRGSGGSTPIQAASGAGREGGLRQGRVRVRVAAQIAFVPGKETRIAEGRG